MSLASMIVQALSQLRDVVLTSPSNGEALIYNSSTGKWVNGSAGSTSPLTTKGDIWVYGSGNTRLPVGIDNYALVADSTQTSGLNYLNISGASSLTTLSNFLSANVAISSANTYYDGPSLSLTTGTWLLIGAVLVDPGVALTDITAKLWDGTTVISSGQTQRQTTYTYPQTIPVSGIVSPTSTTTYKISVANDNASGNILATIIVNNTGATNKASYLLAIKLTGAAPQRSFATKTNNYTIVVSDTGVLVDTSSGPLTITLPTAVSATQVYTIKKKTPDTNAVTIATTSAQTIDGSSTQTLSTQNQSIDVASDNTNWYIL